MSSVTSLDGSNTYTLAALKQSIAAVMSAAKPSDVVTLDYLSSYGCGDHTDHLTTGRITQELVGTYAGSASLEGFMGYTISRMISILLDQAIQSEAAVFY